MKNKLGFTLLEISIVMLIVGLILGGILVGKEMINNATLRSQISQIERYTSAYNSFRLKYNCMPGDCPNATAYGLTNNGNGDENLLPVAGSSYTNLFCGGCLGTYAYENFYFWHHMYTANLIDQSVLSCCYNADTNTANYVKTVPKAKLEAGYIFSGYIDVSWNGLPAVRNSFILSGFGKSGVNGYTGTMTGPEAYHIDSKMDDGIPTRGRVIGLYNGANVRQVNTDLRGGECTSFNGTLTTPSQWTMCTSKSISVAIRFKN